MPADIEAARVDEYAPAANPEAILAEEPPPMALVANRHERQEKSDDSDA